MFDEDDPVFKILKGQNFGRDEPPYSGAVLRKMQEEILAKYNAKNIQQLGFPRNRMPTLLKHLFNESLERERPEYVYASVLMAVAIATQGRLNIATPAGQSFNANLYFEVVGPPGSGKSSVIDKYLNPIRELDDIRCRQHDEAILAADRLRTQHKLEKKRLERRYLKMTDDDETRQEIAEQIAELDSQIWSKPPLSASMLLNDATKSGLAGQLKRNAGSVALINDESYLFYKNIVAPDPGFFSKLYDGREYFRQSDSIDIACASIHFCMLTAIQNGLVAKFYARHRDVMVESGLRSRILTIISTDTVATDSLESEPSGDRYFVEYQVKIGLIFQRFRTPEQVRLSITEATAGFFYNLLLELRQRCQELTTDDGISARVEMHLAKLAGMFALLRNPQTSEIGKKDLFSAYYAVAYHLKMHDILLNQESSYNQQGIAKDAAAVLDKVKQRAKENHNIIELAWLRTRVPASRRSIDALQPILDYLIAIGQIKLLSRPGPVAYALVTSGLQLMPPR